MKGRRMMIGIIGIVVAAIGIAAVLSFNVEREPELSEGIPSISASFDNQKSDGVLKQYHWNGQTTPPNTDFGPPRDALNVAKGETVRFTSNATTQPDYYVTTVYDITQSGDSQLVLDEIRLDGNSLLADFREEREYEVTVTGVWIKIDLFGQSQDYVTYTHLFNVTE
jgi:hypothetical protein